MELEQDVDQDTHLFKSLLSTWDYNIQTLNMTDLACLESENFRLRKYKEHFKDKGKYQICQFITVQASWAVGMCWALTCFNIMES